MHGKSDESFRHRAQNSPYNIGEELEGQFNWYVYLICPIGTFVH